MILDNETLDLDFPEDGNAFSYSYHVLREQEKNFNKDVINNPDDACNLITKHLSNVDIEDICNYIILLNGKNEVIDIQDMGWMYEGSYIEDFDYHLFKCIFASNAISFIRITLTPSIIGNVKFDTDIDSEIGYLNDLANRLRINYYDDILICQDGYISYAFEHQPQ